MDVLRNLVMTLSSLAQVETILVLLVTGTIIIVLEDWRACLWALLAQYVLVGLLLVNVIPLPVALVKVVVGGIVCGILFLTARRVRWGRELVERQEPDQPGPAFRDIFSMNLGFRLVLAVLAALVSYALASRYAFLEQPEGVARACYWLGSIGLLTVIVSRDPFKIGLGLLTFQAGFEVLFAAMENSLSVAALLGVVNLLIALAISYLATAQIAISIEERRR